MGAPDEGHRPVLTFSFVDLAGFTALTDVHGDEAAAAQVLRFCALAVGALDGTARLVKSIGDAVMIGGRDADSVLASTTALVAACLAEPGMPLARAGVHTGTAVERDGDYFGSAVNVAARVAALAAGAQVLVTADLLLALARPGPPVSPLGPTALRNVRRPVELYELLPAACAPPRSAVAGDPGCRMRVEPPTPVARLRHGNKTYWLCSLGCAVAFASDPGSYV